MEIRSALKIIFSSSLFSGLERIKSSVIKSLEEENGSSFRSPDFLPNFSPNYSNFEDFDFQLNDFQFNSESNHIQQPSEHSLNYSCPATFIDNNFYQINDTLTNNIFDHTIYQQEESIDNASKELEDKNKLNLINASDLSDNLSPDNESFKSEIFELLEKFFFPEHDQKVQEDFFNQSMKTLSFISGKSNNLNEENLDAQKDNLNDCVRSNANNNSLKLKFKPENYAKQKLHNQPRHQSNKKNIIGIYNSCEKINDSFKRIFENLKNAPESSGSYKITSKKVNFTKIKGWKSNIDRIYRIRDKIKSIENDLKAINFVEIDDLLKVFIFHVRQIHFWIENNDYGKNKIDEVYKSFANVKIDTSLESIQIKDHRQISNIKDCFWNILLLIKKVLTKRSRILVHDVEFELKCEFMEIFKFLGVKNLNFSVDNVNKSYQDDKITIFRASISDCEKIYVGFNNFVPRRIISMCVYGGNYFILVLYKYLESEVFLFKLNLETGENKLFSKYFNNSIMNNKIKFHVDSHKIIADSIGNLYILQRLDDKFIILVLDQNMIELRSLTEEKLVCDLNIKKAFIYDIKINLDIIYIFDQSNSTIAVYDCLFNFIKSIDIKKYIDPSIENYFTVSDKYIFLVTRTQFYVSLDFGETFLLKYLLFNSKIKNVTCSTTENELIISDVNGKIRFCRIHKCENTIFLKITNSRIIFDKKKL